MSVLKDLWYGNIRGIERQMTSQEHKIMEKVSKYDEKLTEGLSQEQKLQFVKFKEVFSEYYLQEVVEAYEYGVALGVSIGFESCQKLQE